MYGKVDSEDLRNEIYHLKKQLLNATTENNLLKVKIRKLLDEINRKDKQLDAIFDPKKSPDIRKIIYEKNASFIMNIKEKNDKLKKTINEKDAMIKRLQQQLEMVKLYSNGSTQFSNCKFNDNGEENAKKRSNLKVSCKKQENEELKRTRSLSWTPESISKSNNIEEETSKKVKRPASYDVKDQYRGLSREHLLSIIENLKNNQSQCGSSSRKSSPESDLDRIDLYCNSPHEEIQQLHHHFLEMITEVDYLKTTISQLQDEQQKTEHVLKNKDNSIDKLAAEIKNMKKPKSRKKRGNNRFGYEDTFYLNGFSRESNRNYEKSKILNMNFGKSKNLKTRKTKVTKDVMTQIEEISDSDNPPSFRSYINNGSVVIVKKPQATQTVDDLNSNSNDDNEDDEQILEEYDNEQKD